MDYERLAQRFLIMTLHEKNLEHSQHIVDAKKVKWKNDRFCHNISSCDGQDKSIRLFQKVT